MTWGPPPPLEAMDFQKKNGFKLFHLFLTPKKFFACGALMPPHQDFRGPVWAESPYLMFIYLYTETRTDTRHSIGGEGPTAGPQNAGERGS